MQAFSFRNASLLTREATHLEISTLPEEPVYANYTVSATVRVMNNKLPARLQTDRMISVQELPSWTPSAIFAEVDKNYGVATVEFQLRSQPCGQVQFDFEGIYLKGVRSRGLLVHPGKPADFTTAPPAHSYLQVVSLQPLSGDHVVVGQPIQVELRVLDCSGTALDNLDVSRSIVEVSSGLGHVLLRHNTVSIANAMTPNKATIPDLVIDTPGRIQITFALFNQDFGEVSNATVDLDVYQGVWWRPEPGLEALQDLSGSTAVTVDNRVVIFGGLGPDGAVNRLAEYDTASGSVTIVQPSSSLVPSPRFQHAACSQPNVLWVFGGRSDGDDDTIVGDLYRYQLETRTWDDWSARVGRLSNVRHPVLVANSSSLYLFDRENIELKVLPTMGHKGSEWTTVVPPKDLDEYAAKRHEGAVMTIDPHGSSVLILSNTSFFSYKLTTGVWSHWSIPAISVSGNHFSACVLVQGRLLLLGEQDGTATTRVHVLEVPRSPLQSSNLSRSVGGTWLRIADGTVGAMAPQRYSSSLVSLVAFSDTHFLVVGGDDGVLHLSLEAAFGLRVVPATLPMSLMIGTPISTEVQVVDENGALVVGGQRGRQIRVESVANGTEGMTGTVQLPVERGRVVFSESSFSYLSSSLMLLFSDTSGGLRDTVPKHSITILPGNPAFLDILQRPEGLYEGTMFLRPLKVRVLDEYHNFLQEDFQTQMTIRMHALNVTSDQFVDSTDLLAGTRTVAVTAGVAEFSEIAITSDRTADGMEVTRLKLTISSFGLPHAEVDELRLLSFAESDLIIDGFKPRAFTSGEYISAVSVKRVAYLADGSSHLLTGDNRSVISVSLASPSAFGAVTNASGTIVGAEISGMIAQTMVGGSAVFADLSVSRAGTLYRLVLSDSARSGADGICASSSAPSCLSFDVVPGQVTTLSLLPSQACSALGGSALPRQPVVRIADASENIVIDGGKQVNVAVAAFSLSSGAVVSRAPLKGRTAVTSHAGRAFFTDLTIDSVGSYRLVFSTVCLAPRCKSVNITTDSQDCGVAVGEAAKLFVASEPGNATSNLPFANQPGIGFLDQGGNLISELDAVERRPPVHAWLERTWPSIVEEVVPVASITVDIKPGDPVDHEISGFIHWSVEKMQAGGQAFVRHSFVAVAPGPSRLPASRPAHLSSMVNTSVYKLESDQLQFVADAPTNGAVDLAHFKRTDKNGVESHYLVIVQAPVGDSQIFNTTARSYLGTFGQGETTLDETDHSTRICTSNSPSGPSCEVVFADVPGATPMFLTVAVANSDFADEDEVITAVWVGDLKLEGPFLQYGGIDADCNTMSIVIDDVELSSDSISDQGAVRVRLETSSTVGYFQCDGATLYAEVTISWGNIAVYRFEASTDAADGNWQLTQVQTLRARNAYRLKSFEIGGDTFLAVAGRGGHGSHAKPPIFMWDREEEMLVSVWRAPTRNATAWEHFRLESRDMVVVVGERLSNPSNSIDRPVPKDKVATIYEWNAGTFKRQSELLAQGATDVFAFRMSGVQYLLITGNGQHHHAILARFNSELDRFVPVQQLPLHSVSRVVGVSASGLQWILLAARDASAPQTAALHLLVEICANSTAFASSERCRGSMNLTRPLIDMCCGTGYGYDGRDVEQAQFSERHLAPIKSFPVDSHRGLAVTEQQGQNPLYILTVASPHEFVAWPLFVKEAMFGSLTAQVPPNQSVASFSDLTVLRTGEYTIKFTSGRLDAALTLPFEITSGPAYRLVVLQAVGGARGGSAFDSQLHIGALDIGGNLASDANFSVTAVLLKNGIAIEEGYEGVALALVNMSSNHVFECSCLDTAALSEESAMEKEFAPICAFCPLPSVTVLGISGFARFERLGVNHVDANYTIHVTSPGLKGVTTQPFDVTPGPAVSFMIVQQPADSIGGQPLPRQPELMFFDRGRNVAETTRKAAVSAKVQQDPTGVASLQGTTAIQTSGAFANFTDLAVPLSSRGYSLSFTAIHLKFDGTPDSNAPLILPARARDAATEVFAVSVGSAAALSVSPGG